METISIPVSPKVAQILNKSTGVMKALQELIAKFLEACADGKISFDEVLGLISLTISIAGKVFKK